MPWNEFSAHARARAKLNAYLRTLYEDTRVPVQEIARIAGIDKRALHALARRHRWAPREPNKGRNRLNIPPRNRRRRVVAKNSARALIRRL